MVNDGVSPMRPAMADQRVALGLDLTSGLPAVRGDRSSFSKWSINLVLNGAQAMADVNDRQRALTIQSTQDDIGQVLVSIRDSGVGIDPEAASRLYEAFYTTRPNGMGLWICRRIIGAHGGRLWASSNPGPGASFSFTLPPNRETHTVAQD